MILEQLHEIKVAKIIPGKSSPLECSLTAFSPLLTTGLISRFAQVSETSPWTWMQLEQIKFKYTEKYLGDKTS